MAQTLYGDGLVTENSTIQRKVKNESVRHSESCRSPVGSVCDG